MKVREEREDKQRKKQRKSGEVEQNNTKQM